MIKALRKEIIAASAKYPQAISSAEAARNEGGPAVLHRGADQERAALVRRDEAMRGQNEGLPAAAKVVGLCRRRRGRPEIQLTVKREERTNGQLVALSSIFFKITYLS